MWDDFTMFQIGATQSIVLVRLFVPHKLIKLLFVKLLYRCLISYYSASIYVAFSHFSQHFADNLCLLALFSAMLLKHLPVRRTRCSRWSIVENQIADAHLIGVAENWRHPGHSIGWPMKWIIRVHSVHTLVVAHFIDTTPPTLKTQSAAGVTLDARKELT